MEYRSRGQHLPESSKKLPPLKIEGAGNAGCTVHPQPVCSKKHTVVTTGPPKTPGIPCAMVLTAYSALSPATNSSCHRRWRIWSADPGWARTRLRQLDTSNGCQDHTALPSAATSIIASTGRVRPIKVLKKALKRRSSRALPIAHKQACPAIASRARRCRVHRIPPRVADDHDTPLLSG